MGCEANGIVCPARNCHARDFGTCPTGIVAVELHKGIDTYEPGKCVRITKAEFWNARHADGTRCLITVEQAEALLAVFDPPKDPESI